MEHLHRVERVVIEALADERQLLEDVVRDRDDVAADGIGLEDVQQLARAGPDELGAGLDAQDLDRFGHERDRIAAGVGDAAGEDGHVRGRAARDGRRHFPHLLERHDGRDVHLDAGVRQTVDEVVRWHAPGVGDRDLHVDVRAPGRDLARLPLHLVELVGEDLERDRPIGNGREDLLGEAPVVGDAGLPHQRRDWS